MEQKQFVLNVLSLIPDQQLSPIQAQKLFFLIEKKLSSHCGADKVKAFNFQPYNYGPYDGMLTKTLNNLTDSGELSKFKSNGIDHYRIKQDKLQDTSSFLDDKAKHYIRRLTDYIKSLTFKELCFAIYDEYPEMKANSVLVDA